MPSCHHAAETNVNALAHAATAAARKTLRLSLQSSRAANVVMLGAMCRLFGFDKEKMVEAVTDCAPEKFRELNLKAFALGYERVK